jgi:hypothetical protein
MSTSLSALTIHAQEAAEEASHGGLNEWVVGGITLFILFAMLAAFVMFGAGREHS